MQNKHSIQRNTASTVLRNCVSGLALTLALASTATAEHSPWYISAQMGVVSPDSERGDVDNGTLAAFSVGREIGESWAAELRAATFALNAENADRETDQSSLGVDVHWYPFGRLVDDALIRPYVLAGLGFVSTDIGTNFSSDNASATVGFGASLSIFDTGLSLRGEGRYVTDFVDANDVDSFSDWQGTLGVQIPVGRQAETGASPVVAKPSSPQPQPEPEPELAPAPAKKKPVTKPVAEKPPAEPEVVGETKPAPAKAKQESFSPFGQTTEAPKQTPPPVASKPAPKAVKPAAAAPKQAAAPKPKPKPEPAKKPAAKPTTNDVLGGGIADNDGDGIRNSVDLCPGTTSGGYVDADGCPLQMSGSMKSAPIKQVPPAKKPQVAAVKPKAAAKPVAATKPPATKVAPTRSATTMQLKGVTFASGSSTLTSDSLPAIKRVAALMKKKSSLQVEVSGHTDSQGSKTANQALSQERALAVKEALVAEGVNFRRISARGYGDSKPVADNKSAAGREQNRRIELKLMRTQ